MGNRTDLHGSWLLGNMGPSSFDPGIAISLPQSSPLPTGPQSSPLPTGLLYSEPKQLSMFSLKLSSKDKIDFMEGQKLFYSKIFSKTKGNSQILKNSKHREEEEKDRYMGLQAALPQLGSFM